MTETPTIPVASPRDPGQANARERLLSLWEAWTGRIFSLREDQFFLLLAVLIGIFSGLAVVCFRVAIEWTQLEVLGPSLSPSVLRVLLAPTIGGLVVAFLVLRIFPSSQGSGVNRTKAAVYVWNGYVPFETVIGKFVTCALAIGSGQSLGPEDPSLQMGAGIASKIGRSLNLSQEKIRLIAPVGAAAGLAAAFNAPISAVLFVIEEVIGVWSGGVLGAIVLAAVSSVVTMRSFLGADSLFRVPEFRVVRAEDLLGYAVLGLVGGGAAIAFLKWLAYARPRIEKLPYWTKYLQPAGAGLLIGVIGIRFPQVMGAGYSIIDQALHGQFTWKLLLVLAVLKIVATGISFLSGTPGGMFAPVLFIGAMFGGAIGAVEQHFIPTLSGSVGTFALVGMGTFFAGFLRIPITSVFMVIELSGNYTAILPVMISTMVAYFISRRFHKVPLFDMLARQDGLVLPSIEEQREQIAPVVEKAMQRDAALIFNASDPVVTILSRAEGKPELPLLLQSRREWRLLDRDRLKNLAEDKSRTYTAADADGKGPLPILFPDLTLEDALQVVGDWPVLPVVNRADLSKLEGVITLADILRTFRNAPAE
ncbi:MAG TPA: chloride channel protein [Candidatus Acidoferrum sp.]|nr:chloride channel protein [Candidatus Acidoferrum sp.]